MASFAKWTCGLAKAAFELAVHGFVGPTTVIAIESLKQRFLQKSINFGVRSPPSGRLGSGIYCCLARNWRSRRDFSVLRLTISTTDAVHWTRNWLNTSESAGPANATAPARFLCRNRSLNARWGLDRSNLGIWGTNHRVLQRNAQRKLV